MRSSLGFLLALGAMAQNWTQFRGPNASGIADGANPPVSWDASNGTNVVWKTPIPGLAHSSPIVFGDRVFVTTAISSDPDSKFRWGLYGDVEPSPDVSKHTWKIYCLDRKDGKILWERTAHEGVPRTKRHPKSSQATATPVTDGKHVIAIFGSEGMYAYDMNGKQLWKQDIGVLNSGWFFDPDYEWGHGSSPIIYRNSVIVQCDIAKDSYIAAFDVATGKKRWMTPRKEISSWGSPTLVEAKTRAELVTNGTKAIRGYDPATGRELWTFNGNNSEVTVTTPVYGSDLIFVTNGYPPVQPIYAFKPGATGDISLKPGEESNAAMAWGKKRGGPYMPTPVVYQDLLYIVSNSGVVAAYNAKTGERVYQERLTKTGSAHSASPVAADGRIYFASEDGDVFVVKAGPKFELLAKNPVGEVVMATPAITKGMIVLRTQHSVMGIAESEKKSGLGGAEAPRGLKPSPQGSADRSP
jgi:outer membrane protein assembly factor BamB